MLKSRLERNDLVFFSLASKLWDGLEFGMGSGNDLMRDSSLVDAFVQTVNLLRA